MFACRIYTAKHVPEWRNGRRERLKTAWPKGRAGSSPASGTNFCFQGSTLERGRCFLGPASGTNYSHVSSQIS